MCLRQQLGALPGTSHGRLVEPWTVCPQHELLSASVAHIGLHKRVSGSLQLTPMRHYTIARKAYRKMGCQVVKDNNCKFCTESRNVTDIKTVTIQHALCEQALHVVQSCAAGHHVLSVCTEKWAALLHYVNQTITSGSVLLTDNFLLAWLFEVQDHGAAMAGNRQRGGHVIHGSCSDHSTASARLQGNTWIHSIDRYHNSDDFRTVRDGELGV